MRHMPQFNQANCPPSMQPSTHPPICLMHVPCRLFVCMLNHACNQTLSHSFHSSSGVMQCTSPKCSRPADPAAPPCDVPASLAAPSGVQTGSWPPGNPHASTPPDTRPYPPHLPGTQFHPQTGHSAPDCGSWCPDAGFALTHQLPDSGPSSVPLPAIPREGGSQCAGNMGARMGSLGSQGGVWGGGHKQGDGTGVHELASKL